MNQEMNNQMNNKKIVNIIYAYTYLSHILPEKKKKIIIIIHLSIFQIF